MNAPAHTDEGSDNLHPKLGAWRNSRGTALLLTSLLLGACDAPTAVRVENATAAPIYRLWWQTTLFTAAISPGSTSADLRTIPSSDYAYALLAPGWDDTSGLEPVTLLPIQSADRLVVTRGEALEVQVSFEGWRGFCDGGRPLTQDEADLITQRIFPAQFEGKAYTAAACQTAPADAGP